MHKLDAALSLLVASGGGRADTQADASLLSSNQTTQQNFLSWIMCYLLSRIRNCMFYFSLKMMFYFIFVVVVVVVVVSPIFSIAYDRHRFLCDL